ncbi:MAG: diaminopimelate epimerase [Spirochaetia bacterium]|nr:diaminopimelate epimerase [Spirochaetia bacterium]
MSEINFIKMAGTGNDYVYIDCLDQAQPDFSVHDIINLSNRRTGIGSDGLVLITPSNRGIAKMKMWNSDGSPSGMCGNALRCIGFFIFKKFGEKEFLLESDSGVHETKILKVLNDFEALVEVGIGKPLLEAEQIPFLPEKSYEKGNRQGPFISIPVLSDQDKKQEWSGIPDLFGTLVSMGNPHCVIFVENSRHFPVNEIGPWIERHPSFPERTNVEFVTIEEDGTFFQRTFERGSGETEACGSGACAVLVASVLEKKGPLKNQIQLLGGTLEVEWDRSKDIVFLRGAAKETFKGSFFKESL